MDANQLRQQLIRRGLIKPARRASRKQKEKVPVCPSQPKAQETQTARARQAYAMLPSESDPRRTEMVA